MIKRHYFFHPIFAYPLIKIPKWLNIIPITLMFKQKKYSYLYRLFRLIKNKETNINEGILHVSYYYIFC